MGSYACKICDWRDGDTCQVSVDIVNTDLGFRVTLYRVVRIFGINAPEVHSKDIGEKARGIAAKTFAESLAPDGSVVIVRSAKEHGQDKYGRWLASILLGNGKDFAVEMTMAGHALPWDGTGVRPV